MENNFKQQIADLESGLSRLKNIVADENKPGYLKQRALKNIDIQEARIDFFKKGYNFARKQKEAQIKLGGIPMDEKLDLILRANQAIIRDRKFNSDDESEKAKVIDQEITELLKKE